MSCECDISLAGTIGGVLAVSQSQTGGGAGSGGVDAGDYLYFYGANGNVGQVVAWATDFGGTADYAWDTTPATNARLAARYEYDPYGTIIGPDADGDGDWSDDAGPYAAANPFRFSTKYWDAEIGLGYWGYRYYSPILGRWMNRDPIGERGGMNQYAYSASSPVATLDPLGLKSACCRYQAVSGVRTYRESRWQETRECGDQSPEECCSCGCTKGVAGNNCSGKWLRRATEGRCCSCRIERRRMAINSNDHFWVRLTGTKHTAVFIKCEDGRRWFMDHAGKGGHSVIGHATDYRDLQDAAWNLQIRRYPVVQDTDCISCDDVGALTDYAKSFDGDTYGLIQDCYWFARRIMVRAHTLMDTRDECPQLK